MIGGSRLARSVLAGALAAMAVFGGSAVAAATGSWGVATMPRVPGVFLVQDADQLPPEMRVALIRGIQEELVEHGYDAGVADGAMGPRTRAAIRDYQRDAGLTVNGRPSKELLDHLKFAEPQIHRDRTVRPPAVQPPSADAVDTRLAVSVQRELQVRGYYTGALDGIPGPNTQSAVRAFQRDAGLPVTGKIDERLLGELRGMDSNINAGRNT